jgi:hypothetical protein
MASIICNCTYFKVLFSTLSINSTNFLNNLYYSINGVGLLEDVN